MKKLLIPLFALLFFNFAQAQAPQVALVEGIIQTQSGVGVPGLMISIFHPGIGRARPAITSIRGYYSFTSVPLQYDSPWFIEIYWNDRLVGRDQFWVTSQLTSLPTITLPIP